MTLKEELERVAELKIDAMTEQAAIGQFMLARRLLDTYFGEDAVPTLTPKQARLICEWHDMFDPLHDFQFMPSASEAKDACHTLIRLANTAGGR